MFERLREYALAVEPTKLPLLASSALKRFLEQPSLEVLPVADAGASLKALYFKDCIPLMIGCNNGEACRAAIPGHIIKEMPVLDVKSDERQAMESLQHAVHNETSIALFMGKRYLGMVPIRSLLAFIHKENMKEALTTNPLTGLPGNIAIEKEFEKRAGKEPFIICYVDINHFKPYNDKYGFAKGDEVIKYTALILSEACKGHFVGHIGGDDFIVMIATDGAETAFKKISGTFDHRVGVFYNDRHRKQGHMTAMDRQGRVCKFPLVSLSLSAAVINEKCSFQDISSSLASLKTFVKRKSEQEGGSQYAFDKRSQNVVR